MLKSNKVQDCTQKQLNWITPIVQGVIDRKTLDADETKANDKTSFENVVVTTKKEIGSIADTTLVKSGKLEFYKVKINEAPHLGKSYHVEKPDIDGEPFCQHDWEKIGFKVVEGDESSHGYLTDKKHLRIFKEVYKEISREQTGPSREYKDQNDFKRKFNNNTTYDYLRRRLIAKHPTEWQGEKNKPLVDMLELILQAEADPIKLGSYMRIDDLNSGAINETQAKAIFEHEKERIKELAFWDKVPELSTKTPYHFNPIAFVGNAKRIASGSVCKVCGKSLTLEVSFLKTIAPSANVSFLQDFSSLSAELFAKYKIDTCSQVIHLLGHVLV